MELRFLDLLIVECVIRFQVTEKHAKVSDRLSKKAQTAEERKLLSKLGRVKNLWEEDNGHGHDNTDDQPQSEMDYQVEPALDRLSEKAGGNVTSSAGAEHAERVRVAGPVVESDAGDAGRDVCENRASGGELTEKRRADQRVVSLDGTRCVAGNLVQSDLAKDERKRGREGALEHAGQRSQQISTEGRKEQQDSTRTQELENRAQGSKQQQRPQEQNEKVGEDPEGRQCSRQQRSRNANQQERQEQTQELQQQQQLKKQEQRTPPKKQDWQEKKQRQQEHSERRINQDQRGVEYQRQQQSEGQPKQPETQRKNDPQQELPRQRQSGEHQYEEQPKKKKKRRRNKRNSGSRASEGEGEAATRGQSQQQDKLFAESNTPERPSSTGQRSASDKRGEEWARGADQEKVDGNPSFSTEKASSSAAGLPTRGHQKRGEAVGEKTADACAGAQSGIRQRENQKKAACGSEKQDVHCESSAVDTTNTKERGDKRGTPGESHKKRKKVQSVPQKAGAGEDSELKGKQRAGDTNGEGEGAGPAASNKLTERSKASEGTKGAQTGPREASRTAGQEQAGRRSEGEPTRGDKSGATPASPNTDAGEEALSGGRVKASKSSPRETSRTADQRKGKQQKTDSPAQRQAGSGGSAAATKAGGKRLPASSAGSYSGKSAENKAETETPVPHEPDKPTSRSTERQDLAGTARDAGAKRRPQSGGKKAKAQRHKAADGSSKSTGPQKSPPAAHCQKDTCRDRETSESQNRKKPSYKNERRNSDGPGDKAAGERGGGSTATQPHPAGGQQRGGPRGKKGNSSKAGSDKETMDEGSAGKQSAPRQWEIHSEQSGGHTSRESDVKRHGRESSSLKVVG